MYRLAVKHSEKNEPTTIRQVDAIDKLSDCQTKIVLPDSGECSLPFPLGGGAV